MDDWMTPFDGSGIEWHESLPSPYTYQASDFSKLVAAVHEYEARALHLTELLRESNRNLVARAEQAEKERDEQATLAESRKQSRRIYRERADRAEVQLAKVSALVEARKAIGLLRSMIASGETMSKQAEDQVEAGLAALAAFEQEQNQ